MAYTPEESQRKGEANARFWCGFNELLGNNRALVARRFDRAFTTVLGIAVTMIALIRAS
jgi:hypothetical protein